MHSQVRSHAPGQVDIVLPLLLCQTDVLGPPVGNAGLHGLLCRNGQLMGGQWIIPHCQALNLTGLEKVEKGGEITKKRRNKEKEKGGGREK